MARFDKSESWYAYVAQLRKIDFIPADEKDSDLEALCPQTENSCTKKLMKPENTLISRSSLPDKKTLKNQNLVWSVQIQTLPEWFSQCQSFSTSVSLNDAFQVSTIPDCSDVLKHFTNLFHYQYRKRLFKDSSTLPPKKKLMDVLDDFYSFLDYYISCGIDDVQNKEKVKAKAKAMPLIYVEEGPTDDKRCRLAFPNMIVEQLPTELRLHHPPGLFPFLYELPQKLQIHRTLFCDLGMEQKPNILHYARFMQMVHDFQNYSMCWSQKPFPKKFTEWNEMLRSSVTIAQETIVSCASKQANWNVDQTLYLLGNDGELHPCNDLVFRDDYSLSLTSYFTFWWFPASVTEPSLKEKCSFVQSLPEWMKMKSLSKSVTKRISNSIPCKAKPPCQVVQSLRNVLESQQFIEAIKRLYFNENQTMKLEHGSWEMVHKTMKNIKIACYFELWTALQNCDAPHKETAPEKDSCCISAGEVLVLSISHENAVQSDNKFAYHISKTLLDQRCKILPLEYSEMGLTELLKCKNPMNFEKVLDQLNIPTLYHDESRIAASVPIDPPDPVLARKFWSAAINDFEGAKALRKCKNDGENIGNEHIILLTQQVVEKSMKAVLLAKRGPVEEICRIGHDLPFLAQRVEQCYTNVEILDLVIAFSRKCVVVLTQLRYPNNSGIPKTPRERYKPKQAENAIRCSEQIIKILEPFIGENNIF